MNSTDADEEYRRWRRVQDTPVRRNAFVAWYRKSPVIRLIIGVALFGTVLYGIMVPYALRHSPAPQYPVTAQPTVSDIPTDTHSWLAMSDGHYVRCATYSNGGRDYILMPNIDEMQAGANPTVNSSPSDDSWTDACSRVVKMYK